MSKEVIKEEVKEIYSDMNIFQRMSAITNELGFVQKGLEVGYGNSKYKAVSEVDVLEAIKPSEQKYGVFSYPIDTKIEEQMQVTQNTKNGEVTNFYLRIKRTYRFLCVDNPKDFVDIFSYGDGVDSGDKATGKAQTYADKYALMKMYKISTGDDPDKEASKEYDKAPAQSQPKVTIATAKQIETIEKLYTDEEIETMQTRMGKTINNITVQEASKMIKARSAK